MINLPRLGHNAPHFIYIYKKKLLPTELHRTERQYAARSWSLFKETYSEITGYNKHLKCRQMQLNQSFTLWLIIALNECRSHSALHVLPQLMRTILLTALYVRTPGAKSSQVEEFNWLIYQTPFPFGNNCNNWKVKPCFVFFQVCQIELP